MCRFKQQQQKNCLLKNKMGGLSDAVYTRIG